MEETAESGPAETPLATEAGGGNEGEQPAAEEAEETITIEEFIKAEEEAEQDARALLGGQDETVCTFPEGYKPRQALYACATCTPSGDAGVCYGCATNCHEGHELIEIYTKRRFKCDCGNASFQQKCALFEEKPAKNERNSYNHNFVNSYCTCKRPFPDPEQRCDEEMVQCVACEDWFHPSHVGLAKLTELELEQCELLCRECARRLPFLAKCAKAVPEETLKCTEEAEPEGEAEAVVLWPEWRKRLCACKTCQDIYDKYACDWIHDEEDSIEKFNKDAEEKTAHEKPTDTELVRELVREQGSEVAIRMLSEFHKLKRKLVEFMETKKDTTISKGDVEGFFSQLKRARHDEKEREQGGQ